MVIAEAIWLAMLNLACFSVVSASDNDRIACNPFLYKENTRISNCVYYSETINYVQPCPPGYVCTSQLSDSYTCQAEPKPQGLPGEDCTTYINNCEDYCNYGELKGCIISEETGKCTCKEFQGMCYNDASCPALYFCNSGQCKYLLSSGETCTRDYECKYGDFCYIQEGAQSGVCTEFFSLPNGTKLAKCTDEYIGYECLSGYCMKQIDEEAGKITYQCAEISKLDNPETICEYNKDCVGYTVNSKTQVYSECSCGYANNGNAYCELLPGDDIYAAYRDLVIKWVQTKLAMNCHTLRRYSFECLEEHAESDIYYTIVYYYYKIKYWTKIKYVDTEVQKVLGTEYWEAREQYTTHLPVECDPFVEKLSTQTFDVNTCVYYDSREKMNYVQACGDLAWGEFCYLPENITGNFTCVKERNEGAYPGEPCRSGSCTYGTCVDDMCKGAAKGEPCYDNGDCEPGHYCDRVCSPLKPINSICYSDGDCDYNLYCHFDPDNDFYSGKCTKYFSMKSGTKLERCGRYLFNYECESGFCIEEFNESTEEMVSRCSDPYTVERINQPCNAKIDCIAYKSSDKTDYIYSECACGYSQTGDSYCELLSGNDAYKKYINYMKAWLSSGLAKNCNSERRVTLPCIKQYWDTENFFALHYYALKTEYWTKIQDLQLGVLEALTSNYWEAKEDYELNLPLACYSYKCKERKMKFTKNTCAYLKSSTFYLKECPNNYSCIAGPSSVSNYTCQENPSNYPHAYPGEHCKKDRDCFSNRCYKNKCVGVYYGCESDTDCEPGYYCSKDNNCEELSKTICTRDYECDYGTFCNMNGRCNPYFSAQTGTQVSGCNQNDICYKCVSGFATIITNGSTGEGIITCSDEYTLSSKFPHKCTRKAECIGYNAYNETIYTDCECGYSKTAQGYCRLLPGNDAFTQYIKYFRKWTDSKEEKNCNTARRFALECAQEYMDEEDYYHLAYYQYRTLMWPKIQNVAKCTKKMFQTEYWKAKEDLEDYEDDDDDDDGAHSVASLMAGAIFALLIIL